MADPGLSWGGGANLVLTYSFAKFFSGNCMKIEIIWNRGGGCPWRLPLDPPIEFIQKWWRKLKYIPTLKLKNLMSHSTPTPVKLAVLLKMAASPLPVFHTMVHITIQSRTPSLSLFNDPFILPKLYLANCVLQVLSDEGPKKFGGNTTVCG